MTRNWPGFRRLWPLFFVIPLLLCLFAILFSSSITDSSYKDAERSSYWFSVLHSREGPGAIDRLPGIHYKARPEVKAFLALNDSPLQTTRVGASPFGTPVWLEWRKGHELRLVRFHGWILLDILPR
ncbi:MAG: hypothetical protein MUC92_07885 [Fimbriimonadaceae bacterium]|nr:hypothetical protein [Fimbriimonadaceae bacterium]